MCVSVSVSVWHRHVTTNTECKVCPPMSKSGIILRMAFFQGSRFKKCVCVSIQKQLVYKRGRGNTGCLMLCFWTVNSVSEVMESSSLYRPSLLAWKSNKDILSLCTLERRGGGVRERET